MARIHEGKARLCGLAWLASLAVLYYCTVVYAFLPAMPPLIWRASWPIYAASTYDVLKYFITVQSKVCTDSTLKVLCDTHSDTNIIIRYYNISTMVCYNYISC